jgi:hypothetical protein
MKHLTTLRARRLRRRIDDVPRGDPRDARMTVRMTRELRAGIDRAAARDRRVVTDWILRILEDAVAESDAKAAKSGK